MRKSSWEKMKDAKKRNDKQLVLSGVREFYSSLLGGDPLPTQWNFINAPEMVRAYPGPAGCAKTSTLAALVMGRAILVPASQLFVSRADYNDLFLPGSTFSVIQGMIDRLPKSIVLDRDKSPPMKLYIQPAFVEGKADDSNVSVITLMGLRDGLGSTQATGWAVDEADEASEERCREIIMRLRAPVPDPGDYFAAYVFNPPSKTHWLYTACTGKDNQGNIIADPWMHMYKPMPRENVKNLPADYYDRMRHLSPEQQQRYVQGEWGSVFPGSPVYKEFKQEFHGKHGLKHNPNGLMFRFWDFGYNRPVCIWAQLTPFGHLRCLREVIGHMEEVEPFAARVKAMSEVYYPGMEFRDYGDPAVKQHKDTGSALAKLYAAGIQILYRQSKNIDEGLGLIRTLLGRVVQAEALLQFDLDNCPALVDAMKGGYRLDKLGEKPVKDGFYEHPADAYRYGVLNVFGGILQSMQNQNNMQYRDNLAYDPSEDY